MLNGAGPRGPYSASTVSPATIVGSANGRSITAFTTFLPRKSSRTSTHAMSVPMNALTSVTTTERPSVSLSAATASRSVTALQNASQPPSNAFDITAASGSRTMKLKKRIATPRPSAAPPGSETARGREGTGAALAAGADTEALLDLGHEALFLVEELVGDHVPAAELLDREQALRLRVLLGIDQARVDRAVALLSEDLLGRLGPEVVHELLGVAARVLCDRDRVLDQDRLVRDHVVELLALLLCGDRLVLVGDEHVPLAAGEGLKRVTRRLVLHGDVLEQLLQIGERLFRGLALGDLAAVRRHHVPARAARGERVRRDDLNARLDQVVPALDVLRIALADDEGDHGVCDHALGRRGVPVLVDDAGVHEPRDVGLERELDDVGALAGLDRAALIAGRPVGLGEVDALAVGGLLELRDDRVVRLLGGGVRDDR